MPWVCEFSARQTIAATYIWGRASLRYSVCCGFNDAVQSAEKEGAIGHS